ncbi:MAG: hypothetical protein AAFP04_08955 [Myxococcota bacterium]
MRFDSMMVLALIVSGLAYGAFYVALPGRGLGLKSRRGALGLACGLAVSALLLSGFATQSATGPMVVVTVMIATGTGLAMLAPFLWAVSPRAGRQHSKPSGSKVTG